MVFLWIIGNEYQGGMPLLMPPLEPTENNLWEKESRIILCVNYQRHKEKVLKGALLMSRVEETMISHKILICLIIILHSLTV